MFGQFGSKKNPCNMRFMHYHSMHYDNFYCTYQKVQKIGQGAQEYVLISELWSMRRRGGPTGRWRGNVRLATQPIHPTLPSTAHPCQQL